MRSSRPSPTFSEVWPRPQSHCLARACLPGCWRGRQTPSDGSSGPRKLKPVTKHPRPSTRSSGCAGRVGRGCSRCLCGICSWPGSSLPFATPWLGCSGGQLSSRKSSDRRRRRRKNISRPTRQQGRPLPAKRANRDAPSGGQSVVNRKPGILIGRPGAALLRRTLR
jgi:hypothetical protein